MKNAEYKADTCFILGNATTQIADVKTLLFRSTSSTVTFPGYLAALDMTKGEVSTRPTGKDAPSEKYYVGQRVFLHPRLVDSTTEDDREDNALDVEDYDDAADMSVTRNMEGGEINHIKT